MNLGSVGQPDARWGAVTNFRGSVSAPRLRPKTSRVGPGAPEVPEWARSAAPAEPRPPRPLAPSQLVEDREPAPLPTEQSRLAARRGTLIHQLLERLADVEPADRHQRALAWLEKAAGLPDAAQRAEIADMVCEVLRTSALPGCSRQARWAKRPCSNAARRASYRWNGRSSGDRRGSRIRLGLQDRKGARRSRSNPPAHRAQMDAYVAALGVIFPGHEVRAALLYTNGPQLFEL